MSSSTLHPLTALLAPSCRIRARAEKTVRLPGGVLGSQAPLPGGIGSLKGFTQRQRHFTRVQASEDAKPWSEVPKAAVNDISAFANEEMVLLLFQLELDTQLQRALNYEAFDVAQEIRRRRDEVDAAARKIQEKKGDKSGSKGASQMQALDMATEGLRLRSELQRAVEEERYSDAAKIRDELKAIDEKMRGTSALAGEWNVRTEPKYRLGQRVLHCKSGYRAAVVGWDYGCCETTEFAKKSGADQTKRGLMQPFYRLLVDMRDMEKFHIGDSPVSYVAEELLTAPEDPDTWRKAYGPEGMHHPYLYLLFLGFDNNGDLIPVRALRELYGQKRRDVHPPKEEEGEEGTKAQN